MIDKIKTLHIALQNSDKKQAEIFFTKILKLPLIKTFTISDELSNEIFGFNQDVIVDVYGNEESCFEVFISKKQINKGYEHTCIEINDKKNFINKCKRYKIEPIFVKKGTKTLLFIKDFSGNLFEIKEKEK
jgi:hypothetical protein